MKRLKLSADCTQDLFKKIKEACQKDKRSLASFVRVACLERASKLLEAEHGK